MHSLISILVNIDISAYRFNCERQHGTPQRAAWASGPQARPHPRRADPRRGAGGPGGSGLRGHDHRHGGRTGRGGQSDGVPAMGDQGGPHAGRGGAVEPGRRRPGPPARHGQLPRGRHRIVRPGLPAGPAGPVAGADRAADAGQDRQTSGRSRHPGGDRSLDRGEPDPDEARRGPRRVPPGRRRGPRPGHPDDVHQPRGTAGTNHPRVLPRPARRRHHSCPARGTAPPSYPANSKENSR